MNKSTRRQDHPQWMNHPFHRPLIGPSWHTHLLRILTLCAMTALVSNFAAAQTVRFANGLPAGELVAVESEGLQVKGPRGDTAMLPWAQLSPGTRFRHQPGYREHVDVVLADRPVPAATGPTRGSVPTPAVGAQVAQAAPATPSPAAAPAAAPTTTLIQWYSDTYTVAAMPPIQSRSDTNFMPFGIRFGTGEKDVAFFLFSARRKDANLPDTAHLWIPGHPDYTEPKPLRGRDRNNLFVLPDIQFSSQDAGVQRQIKIDLEREPGERGNFKFDLTATLQYQGQRTVMLYAHARSSSSVHLRPDHVRVVTMFEKPEFLLRVAGNGTEVSCNLSMGKEWFLLPLEGMDTAIRIEVRDMSGNIVETQTIPGNVSSFAQTYGWTTRLRNLKKDERYRVRASINLGPWFGELSAEVGTQLVDRRI